MSNPTIVRLSDATFVKTSGDVYHTYDDSDGGNYSELGGVKHQQKKAARQQAKIERKTQNAQARVAKVAARTELKTARKVGRVQARAAKKDVRVASKIARKDAKVGARIARRGMRQDVGTGASLGQPIEDTYTSPATEQELMEMDAPQQFEQPIREQSPYENEYNAPEQEYASNEPSNDGTVYQDELPEQDETEYESDYEDESEDPESESFVGFIDEFDEAHYQATGKRSGRKMKQNFKFRKTKKVIPTVIARDKIKNVACGHNRIDLGYSGFGGGANTLVTSLVTLSVVAFAGFLVYKYAPK